MERQRNYLAGPVIVLALFTIFSVYVIGYYALSEVQVLPVGEVRVFSSRFIYGLYYPVQAIEQKATGRRAGYSS